MTSAKHSSAIMPDAAQDARVDMGNRAYSSTIALLGQRTDEIWTKAWAELCIAFLNFD